MCIQHGYAPYLGHTCTLTQPLIIQIKAKNGGLLGGSSMHVHGIGALVCANTHGLHIPRAILPQDPEDFRQDRRDEGLPVNRSVWTTCGHVVSVRNELALAVRFE